MMDLCSMYYESARCGWVLKRNKSLKSIIYVLLAIKQQCLITSC